MAGVATGFGISERAARNWLARNLLSGVLLAATCAHCLNSVWILEAGYRRLTWGAGFAMNGGMTSLIARMIRRRFANAAPARAR